MIRGSAGLQAGFGYVSIYRHLSRNINGVYAKAQNVTAITFISEKSRYCKTMIRVIGTCASGLSVYFASARSTTEGKAVVTVNDLRRQSGEGAEGGFSGRFVGPKLGRHLLSVTELDNFAPISALVEGFGVTEARV